MTNAKPPGHLSSPAKRLWKDIVGAYGFDDAAGLSLLEQGMEALDTRIVCRKAIATDGALVLDRFGQSKPHPLLAVERDARSAFLQALKSLNLDLEPLRDAPAWKEGVR